MRYKTQSSNTALFMNGKWPQMLNPWKIEVNTENETITVNKRNPYLIGVDEKVLTINTSGR